MRSLDETNPPFQTFSTTQVLDQTPCIHVDHGFPTTEARWTQEAEKNKHLSILPFNTVGAKWPVEACHLTVRAPWPNPKSALRTSQLINMYKGGSWPIPNQRPAAAVSSMSSEHPIFILSTLQHVAWSLEGWVPPLREYSSLCVLCWRLWWQARLEAKFEHPERILSRSFPYPGKQCGCRFQHAPFQHSKMHSWRSKTKLKSNSPPKKTNLVPRWQKAQLLWKHFLFASHFCLLGLGSHETTKDPLPGHSWSWELWFTTTWCMSFCLREPYRQGNFSRLNQIAWWTVHWAVYSRCQKSDSCQINRSR